MDQKTKLAIGAGAKAKDIVAQMKAVPLNPEELAKQEKVKVADLGLLWRQRVKMSHPDYIIAEFTQKQNGQIIHLRDKLGQATPLVLAQVISHWADFAAYVKAYHGYKKPPSYPQVWFVLMQVEALMNWYQGLLETSSHPVEVKIVSLPKVLPTINTAHPAAIDHIPATPADLAVIEEMLKDG